MTIEEAAFFYFQKKNAKSQNDRMEKSEIREELRLKHSFSDEEIKRIMREITALELDQVEFGDAQSKHWSNHIYISYFFILFGIGVIVTCIFMLRQLYNRPVSNSPISSYLPYVMIVGALFILSKHIKNIIDARKR